MATASLAFTAGAKQAPWQGATLAACAATTTMASTRRSGQLLGEAIGDPGHGATMSRRRLLYLLLGDDSVAAAFSGCYL